MEGKIYIMNSLNYLIITGNKFNSIYVQSLYNRLEYFEADSNKFNEDIVDQLINLTKLKILKLSNNEFTKFPYELKELKRLEKLYLSDNKLTGTLSNDILNLEKLSTLALWNNELEGELKIPNNLIELDIDNNYFTSYSLYNNTKLIYLSASNNQFDDDLLENIVDIVSLEYLYVNYNYKITKIPSNINNLTNLKEISLANTSIKKIPNSIFLLSNLSYFDISNNPQLSVKIIKFPNLATEYINSCKFTNTNILCYQGGTCKDDFNINKRSMYQECSQNDIKEINPITNNNNNSTQTENDESSCISRVSFTIVYYTIISITLLYTTYI